MPRWLRSAPVVVVALMAMTTSSGLMTACARDETTPPPTTSTTTSSPSPTTTASSPDPTTTSPSTADQLADFFSGAQRTDVRLAHVARLINQHVLAGRIQCSDEVQAAVLGIDPQDLVHLVPGGLPDPVQQHVLVVYADLWARRAAMKRLSEGCPDDVPVDGTIGRNILSCLANGAAPAAAFTADLQAARTVAARYPAIVVPAASSRAAAEVAIRAHNVHQSQMGCEECGTAVVRPWPMHRIVWRTITEGPTTWDGTIGTTGRFAVEYTADGWQVVSNAC